MEEQKRWEKSMNRINPALQYVEKIEEISDIKKVAQKAVEIAEALIEEKGYMAVNNMVVTKLTKDVPFLFRTA